MVPAAPVISASALKQRDRCAWNQAYDRHVGDVYAFIFYLVRGNRSVAEDINQETWLAAIDRIENFCPERGQLRGWLFGIARNQVAMHFRRALARGDVQLGDEPVIAMEDEAGCPVLPEDVVECVERQGVVRAAILAMSRECREVLMSKYVDGLSVNEIAAHTGRTPKAIESLLSRARGRLRVLLKWYFPTPPGDERQ